MRMLVLVDGGRFGWVKAVAVLAAAVLFMVVFVRVILGGAGFLVPLFVGTLIGASVGVGAGRWMGREGR